MKLGRLYHGAGGDFAPNTPLLDRLISRRMAARGLMGTRDVRKAIYGATSASQALGYARNGDPAHIHLLEPLPGALLGYQEHAGDMILDLESFSADLKLAGRLERYPVLQDCGGEVTLMESYLAERRGREALARLVDHYLMECPVREFIVSCPDELATFLADHQGEVWITGPYRLHQPPEMIAELQALYPSDALDEEELPEEELELLL